MCCGYMIKKLNYDVKTAIFEFESARGQKIESTRKAIFELEKD